MCDLSIPDVYDPLYELSEFNKFKFYELSQFSAIANIPDDVKYDWINAIKSFVDILENNKDKFTDKESLFDKIKKRVNKLYSDRLSEYLNTIE